MTGPPSRCVELLDICRVRASPARRRRYRQYGPLKADTGEAVVDCSASRPVDELLTDARIGPSAAWARPWPRPRSLRLRQHRPAPPPPGHDHDGQVRVATPRCCRPIEIVDAARAAADLRRTRATVAGSEPRRPAIAPMASWSGTSGSVPYVADHRCHRGRPCPGRPRPADVVQRAPASSALVAAGRLANRRRPARAAVHSTSSATSPPRSATGGPRPNDVVERRRRLDRRRTSVPDGAPRSCRARGCVLILQQAL
jgi:hypothetical protein